MYSVSPEIFDSNVQAVICDMDGLLIDSESWTFNAWILACKDVGYDLPREVAFSGVGKGREPFKKMIKEYFGEDFDVALATAARIRVGNEMLKRDGMPLRPGAAEFLSAIKLKKLPLGLATSTFKEDALSRLKVSGIDLGIFDEVTFGDEVCQLKPDPEIYLTTAKKLDIEPKNIIAFEDSLSGVKSALAAGMKVVRVPDMETSSTPEIDRKIVLKKSLLECLLVAE